MHSSRPSRRKLIKEAAALSAAAWLPPVRAAEPEWPDRPVRLVVPFPPGGSGDALARIIGQDVSKRLKQPIVVENKPGGNMFIGASAVENAPADGYTFLLTLDSLFTVNPYGYDKIPYNPKNFAPVSLVTTQAQCFVCRRSLGVNTMAEFINLAREKPGKLNFGYGSPLALLSAELLRVHAGVQMSLVAYRGGAPATMALLAEEVDVVALDPSLFLQHMQGGKLTALGQVGLNRSKVLPQVPTMFEQGLKGFEALGWFGVFAPAKTPAPIISRLSKEIITAIAVPEVQQQILRLGFEPVSSTPKALADRWREDAARWERLIKTSNIKLNT